MCGIAGFLDFRSHQAQSTSRETIRRMTQSLSHRGPDDEGILVEGRVALGHRRLAIIDLSPRGHQPMVAQQGNFSMVFNGEIYNFKDLRKDLTQRGHSFESETDSEVVLKGFIEWGQGIWKKLDGFFAAAIWNKQNEELTLARDPFGIKPLFYATTSSNRFIFGSELKSILASGDVPFEVNVQSVSDFLTYFYTPGPETAISGIRHVIPGTFLIATKGGIRSEPFWCLELDSTLKHASLLECAERLRTESAVAVKKSLVSDVPVGLLLSAGIDSNMILQELLRLGRQDLKIITVGFRDSGFDESEIVKRRLDHVGLTGDFIFLEDVKDLPSLFDQVVLHQDSLSANVANIPVFLMFQQAASKVKVALMGSGNDELFAGYSTYMADVYRERYLKIPAPFRRLLSFAAHQLPAREGKYSFDYLARKFTEGAELDALRAHYWWRTIFSDTQKGSILNTPFLDAYRHYESFYSQGRFLKQQDQMLYADFKMFCVENANLMADNLSMAHSLEIRPPFLTKDFVNLAFSLPYELKLNRNNGKHLLKLAYRGQIPDEILDAKKSGLVSPIHSMLRGPLNQYVRDELKETGDLPFLSKNGIQNLIATNDAHAGKYSYQIYSLFTLVRWTRIMKRLAQERILDRGPRQVPSISL